jgi:hypothetical protein
MPTGLRILNFSKHRTAALELRKAAKQIVKEAMAKKAAELQNQENRIASFLER